MCTCLCACVSLHPIPRRRFFPIADHVEAVAGMHSPLSRSHHGGKIPRCLAVATSAVPPVEQLFNGSICVTRDRLGFDALTRLKKDFGKSQVVDDMEDILVAQPTLLPIYDSRDKIAKHVAAERKKRGAHRTQVQATHHSRRKYASIFFVSSGVVTSFDPSGKRTWSRKTDSTWSLDEIGSDDSADSSVLVRKLSMMTTVSPFRSREHGKKDHILAVGERVITLLSSRGQVRGTAVIEDIPVGAPVIADFSGDGYSDVIISTTHGYYGFVLERRVGTKLFTLLVGAILAALLVVLVIHMADNSSKKNPKRNTAPSRHVPTRTISNYTVKERSS